MKALVALLASLSMIGTATADTIDVQLINFSFVPANITIEVGDTVRWTFVSGGGHTVHEGLSQFPTPTTAFGASVEPLFPIFEVTFDAAFLATFPRTGDFYDYHCIPHFPGMSGTIQVTDNTTGISFCSGDGGDQMGCTNCPCSNNAPQGTVGGCVNSASTSAQLVASGNASVSLLPGMSSDLRFQLHGAPPAALCVLTSGDALAPTNPGNSCTGQDSGLQSSLFDGLRCAVMNVRRHGGRPATASGDVGVTTNPWGGEGGPNAGIAVAFGGFASGQTRYFQVTNRDNSALGCMRGLNTSQAIEITFTP